VSTVTDRPSADTFVRPEAPRSWKTPIVLGVLALTVLIGFGILGDPGQVSFAWSDPEDAIALDPLVVTSSVFCLVAGIIALLAAGLSTWMIAMRRKIPFWIPLIVGFAFLASLLAWVGAGSPSQRVPVVFLLTGAIALSAAVIYGALAGVIGERVGVTNIAIEGQLLAGAFTGAFVGSITGNQFAGLVAAMAAGCLVSAVLAVFAIKYLVDQIIVGVVLNVIIIGLTDFLFSAVLADNEPELNRPGTLPFLPIPGLSDIPVLGPVLFDHRITTYLIFVLVPVVWFFLFRTRAGLRIRALGEYPLAADTVGINVLRTRFWTVTLAGAIAGLGGAALTLGSNNAFVPGMSAGQGYIALAAVILGRWNPWLAAIAGLLFGFARNFRIWAVGAGSPIPPDLIAMTPYLVTLFAVAVLIGRAVAPASVAKPYIKG
jgi:general nucleoside transport system permease protein